MVELPQNLTAECVGPDCDGTSNNGMEIRCVTELGGSSTEVSSYVEIGSGKENIEREVHLEGPSLIECK